MPVWTNLKRCFTLRTAPSVFLSPQQLPSHFSPSVDLPVKRWSCQCGNSISTFYLLLAVNITNTMTVRTVRFGEAPTTFNVVLTFCTTTMSSVIIAFFKNSLYSRIAVRRLNLSWMVINTFNNGSLLLVVKAKAPPHPATYHTSHIHKPISAAHSQVP
jgi:hypothetical protein